MEQSLKPSHWGTSACGNWIWPCSSPRRLLSESLGVSWALRGAGPMCWAWLNFSPWSGCRSSGHIPGCAAHLIHLENSPWADLSLETEEWGAAVCNSHQGKAAPCSARVKVAGVTPVSTWLTATECWAEGRRRNEPREVSPTACLASHWACAGLHQKRLQIFQGYLHSAEDSQTGKTWG